MLYSQPGVQDRCPLVKVESFRLNRKPLLPLITEGSRQIKYALKAEEDIGKETPIIPVSVGGP